MADIDTPQFDMPFRLEADGSDVVPVEQDSVKEVADCVEGFLRTPLGWFEEQPDLGLDDPTFSEGDVDLDALQRDIENWEERAEILIDRGEISLDTLVQNININVEVRSDG